jgi:hypothetical protein
MPKDQGNTIINIPCLDKFAEVIDRHLGKKSNPAHAVKMAKAIADKKRILAQGKSDAKKIKKGQAELVNVSAVELCAIEDKPQTNAALFENHESQYHNNIGARIQHQEERKDKNLQKIVANAAIELMNEETPIDSEHEVDDDLVSRIFEEAAHVSHEDLQKLWGRLLTNTISKPDSCSVDLVDFMRRLTNKRAKDISRLGPYIFSLNRIVKTQKTLDALKTNNDLSYLLEMSELGVISGVDGVGLEANIKSQFEGMFLSTVEYGKMALQLESKTPETAAKLPAFKVTELGRQVLSLGHFEYDYEYLRQIGLLIKKQGFTVTLMDTVSLENGIMRHKPKEVL